MHVAREYAKRLTVLNQLSPETGSYWFETCFVAREYARRLTVLNQVSVETESYLLETGLLQQNMQGRFPFLNSFRWKQNLIGWRQVYGTRICQADSGSQTAFGGKRTGLPITIGLALWWLEVGAIGFGSLLCCSSSLTLAI